MHTHRVASCRGHSAHIDVYRHGESLTGHLRVVRDSDLLLVRTFKRLPVGIAERRAVVQWALELGTAFINECCEPGVSRRADA